MSAQIMTHKIVALNPIGTIESCCAPYEGLLDVSLPHKFLEKLVTLLRTHLDNNNIALLGVTGCSGSGKSVLTKALTHQLPPILNGAAVPLSLDLYLRAERKENWKAVMAIQKLTDYWSAVFRIPVLADDLHVLRSGGMIDRLNMHSRVTGRMDAHLRFDPATLRRENGKVLIICDGVPLLHPDARSKMDFVLLLDTPKEVCYARRAERSRYRSPEETQRLFNQIEYPLFDLYRPSVTRSGEALIVTEDASGNIRFSPV